MSETNNGDLWVITYYGTGMTPKRKTFVSEEEAIETWDKWVLEAYKGATSLKKESIIRTRYTYKGKDILG